MEIAAVTWNLFHGRDFPPDPGLFTWRSRAVGSTTRNETHVQVNRDLGPEFAAVLSAARWDVALLQECPPRWSANLAAACEAEAQRSLTSRNWLGSLRDALARGNPDLLGSWEGGSNLTLIRGPLREAGFTERRVLVLRRLPERRTMAFARLGSALCLANLHASTAPRAAVADVRRAAEAASAWAGHLPLIFGGDFNLRPSCTRVFEELAERLDLQAASERESIDHLLARGLDVVAPEVACPAEAREVPEDGLRLRLSDHAPIKARYRTRPRVETPRDAE
jgi:endonuclease/exonuclease/phosphatase family metal-dependent hydrolase